jgi:hypothetical protein
VPLAGLSSPCTTAPAEANPLAPLHDPLAIPTSPLPTHSPPSRSSHVASTDLADLVPANSLQAAKCRAASRSQSNTCFCRANDLRAYFLRRLRATRSPNLFRLLRNGCSRCSGIGAQIGPEHAPSHGIGKRAGQNGAKSAFSQQRQGTAPNLRVGVEEEIVGELVVHVAVRMD